MVIDCAGHAALRAFGADILRRVDLGLFTLTVSKEYAKIIIGLAIVAAVAVDRLSEHLRERRAAARDG